MQHGLLPSFMTKPFIGRSGSSSHLHLSLFDGGRNIFWDADESELTQEFHWAIGGLLEHAPRLNAFLGPTVNCAKRYRKGTYAPASVTWGFENRSVAMRVKAGRGDHDAHREPPRLGGLESLPRARGHARRRCSTASRGGSSRRSPWPRRLSARPSRSSPGTLEESLDAFESDEALRDAFHPEFVQAFLALKRHEIEEGARGDPRLRGDEWHDEVTEWERDQFLFLA